MVNVLDDPIEHAYKYATYAILEHITGYEVKKVKIWQSMFKSYGAYRGTIHGSVEIVGLRKINDPDAILDLEWFLSTGASVLSERIAMRTYVLPNSKEIRLQDVQKSHTSFRENLPKSWADEYSRILNDIEKISDKILDSHYLHAIHAIAYLLIARWDSKLHKPNVSASISGNEVINFIECAKVIFNHPKVLAF